MSLWVIGTGMLFGVVCGDRLNGKRLLELPFYKEVAQVCGPARQKKYSFVYLMGGGKRSIKRRATVLGVLLLVVMACSFFFVGYMTFMRQILPAVWMCYFTRLLTLNLTNPSVARKPAMALTPNGMWIKKDNGQLCHMGWDSVHNVLVVNSKGIMSGGIIEKTFSFKPRRVEVCLKDGTMFAADGIFGNIMPLADKFSRWVPARNVKIG